MIRIVTYQNAAVGQEWDGHTGEWVLVDELRFESLPPDTQRRLNEQAIEQGKDPWTVS